MAEVEEADPRAREMVRVILDRLAAFMHHPLDQHSLDRMQEVVDATRDEFRLRHGREFPEMAPLYLPSVGYVGFLRRDLTNEEIQNHLVMLLRTLGSRGARISAIEVAAAVTRVWPRYDPPIEVLRRDPKSKLKLQ